MNETTETHFRFEPCSALSYDETFLSWWEWSGWQCIAWRTWAPTKRFQLKWTTVFCWHVHHTLSATSPETWRLKINSVWCFFLILPAVSTHVSPFVFCLFYRKKKTMKLSRALSDLVKYTRSVGLYDIEAQGWQMYFHCTKLSLWWQCPISRDGELIIISYRFDYLSVLLSILVGSALRVNHC